MVTCSSRFRPRSSGLFPLQQMQTQMASLSVTTLSPSMRQGRVMAGFLPTSLPLSSVNHLVLPSAPPQRVWVQGIPQKTSNCLNLSASPRMAQYPRVTPPSMLGYVIIAEISLIPLLNLTAFNQVIQMESSGLEGHEREIDLRTYFTVIETDSSLSLTLINPNITAATLTHLQHLYSHNTRITAFETVIIACPNFDDALLSLLAQGIPKSCTSVSLDFTECESLRGEGFLSLFEAMDGLALTVFKLEMGSVCNINDIVFEGLCLFLSNLPRLEELYLDFYQIAEITEEGYLLLGQTLSELQELTHLHLDFSAQFSLKRSNHNITEDALELIFVALSPQLTSFSFKILDVEHIGGGSFFKLADSLSEMSKMQDLELTISTFARVSGKAIEAVLSSLGQMGSLRRLGLNLSDLDLPEKTITFLPIPSSLVSLSLDLSCNRRITEGDALHLFAKAKGLQQLDFNFDFCTNVTEDVLEELVEMIAEQGKCRTLLLRDRNYTQHFHDFVADKLHQLLPLVRLEVGGKKRGQKLQALTGWLKQKERWVWVCVTGERKNLNRVVTKEILSLLFVQS